MGCNRIFDLIPHLVQGCVLIFLSVAGVVLCSASTCPVDVTNFGVSVGENQSVSLLNQNTKALNALFTGIRGGTIPCHNVHFPEGIIEINAPIIVDVAPIGIIGVNRATSQIRQVTANQPIFIWQTDLPGNRQAIVLQDLGFTNLNPPTSNSGSQWGLRFQCTADGSGGIGYGYYENVFERLQFNNMYIGIGTYTINGGVCSLWSTHFTDLSFQSTKHSAIQLTPSGAIGQPALVFDRVDITNFDKSILSDGPAIAINSANGLQLRSVDIENWHNTALQFFGGSATIIDNPRLEHHVFEGSYPVLFAFSNNDFSVRALTLSFDSVVHSGVGSVFSLLGGAAAPVSLDLSGINISTTQQGSFAPIQLFRGDPAGARASVAALTLANGFSEYLPSGWGSDEYVRSAIDGRPPVVDLLPAASPGFRFRSFTVTSAGGLDRTYQCLQTSPSSFIWK